jgi:two-component system cell cycle sensor histidine kinase/response regulator CckA
MPAVQTDKEGEQIYRGEILTSLFPNEQSRILVMDDEPFILDIASTILRQIEYDVVTAANGDEAIAKTAEAIRSGRRFVAAVLDLTIPGGRGGKETAPELVKMDPDMKVIVSSGYSDDPVMARPAEYGFSGKLIKPYRRAAVVQLFDSLFGHAH